ncbi:MAG: regulatory protein RecX [Clostridia bacterium]|nr:regulatory protein RecX [Clostridia bacterium]
MVRVSEIETVRGRVRILLDDGTAYTILKSMFRERPLAVNEELDPEEYAGWVAARQYRSAMDKAVSRLAVRACSRGEIEQKLRRTGYSTETIERVLGRLEKEGFLNDREFAGQWASYRAGQKIGPRRIAQELRSKGIAGREAEEALEALSGEEQMEAAAAVARKLAARAKPGEDPRKVRRRILEGVVRRGYDWETARLAADRAMDEAAEETRG